MKLIDKDALVAEIDDWRDKIMKGILIIPLEGHKRADATFEYEILGLVRDFIDTIDVKEVDLKKELEYWRHNHFHGRRDKEASGEYLERISQLELVKHFFELGMRQSNNDNNNEEKS